MSKLIFLDLETTGRDHKNAAIIQLAAVITGMNRPVDTINLKMRPHEDAYVNEEALKVSGVTPADFLRTDYLDHREGKRQFEAKLSSYVNRFDKSDKFHMIGYNIGNFDVPFLRAWFDRCGDKYYGSWFWHPVQDLMYIAAYRLRHVRHNMSRFDLGTVCKHLNIPVDKEQQHDALYDVYLCIELWKALIEREV